MATHSPNSLFLIYETDLHSNPIENATLVTQRLKSLSSPDELTEGFRSLIFPFHTAPYHLSRYLQNSSTSSSSLSSSSSSSSSTTTTPSLSSSTPSSPSSSISSSSSSTLANPLLPLQSEEDPPSSDS